MNSEDRLSRALRQRAAHAAGAPDMDDVVNRAHRIQRRRRTTAAAVAVVAVAAIAIPSALLLGGSPDSAPGPAVSSKTPNPSTGPGLDSIARGKAIGEPYLEDNVIHYTPNNDVQLPDGNWTSFAPYHGGTIAATSGRTPMVSQFDGTGKLVASHIGTGIAMSNDQLQTMWWWADGANGTGHLLSGISSGMADGEARVAIEPVTPVGYFAGNGVYDIDTDPGGVEITCFSNCVTHLDNLTRATDVFETDGPQDSTALFAGDIPDPDGSQCAGVVELKRSELATTGTRHVSPTVLWHNCDGVRLGQFSPDGRYVVAFASNGLFGNAFILDAATGHRVASYDGKVGVAFDGPVVWEDATHLLAEVKDPSGNWAVLRIGTDGSVERASDVLTTTGPVPPIAFGVRP
jgi:hypothetical protein